MGGGDFVSSLLLKMLRKISKEGICSIGVSSYFGLRRGEAASLLCVCLC